MDGQGWHLPTQVLADQLTLFQPEGTDCFPHSITCPPMSFVPVGTLSPLAGSYDAFLFHFNSCTEYRGQIVHNIMKQGVSLEKKMNVIIFFAAPPRTMLNFRGGKSGILEFRSNFIYRHSHSMARAILNKVKLSESAPIKI